MHFSVFGGGKIGARATMMEGVGRGRESDFALAPIFARSKSERCFKSAEGPTETLATQAIVSRLPGRSSSGIS